MYWCLKPIKPLKTQTWKPYWLADCFFLQGDNRRPESTRGFDFALMVSLQQTQSQQIFGEAVFVWNIFQLSTDYDASLESLTSGLAGMSLRFDCWWREEPVDSLVKRKESNRYMSTLWSNFRLYSSFFSLWSSTFSVWYIQLKKKNIPSPICQTLPQYTAWEPAESQDCICLLPNSWTAVGPCCCACVGVHITFSREITPEHLDNSQSQRQKREITVRDGFIAPTLPRAEEGSRRFQHHGQSLAFLSPWSWMCVWMCLHYFDLTNLGSKN